MAEKNANESDMGTDRPTDQPTDIVSYRGASSHLKRPVAAMGPSVLVQRQLLLEYIKRF
jgi:hypothetical protein